MRCVACVAVPLAFLSLVAGLIFAQSQNPSPTPREGIQEPKANASKQQKKATKPQCGTEANPCFVIPAKNPEIVSTQDTNTHQNHSSPEWWLVYITAPLVAATLGLMCYTAFLWLETKRLVKQTMVAESPFLFPEVQGHRGFFQAITDRRRPFFIYGFRNDGKTPATISRFRDYALFTNNLPQTPRFDMPWERRNELHIPIASQTEGGQVWIQIPEGMSGADVLSRLGQDDHWLYIVGEVQYEDVFDGLWIQGYCWRITEITSETFTPWRDGGSAYNYRRKMRPA